MHSQMMNLKIQLLQALHFFRNELGLTERKGNPVKYDATVVADGMTIKQKISDRASFYQKIVSPAAKKWKSLFDLGMLNF